MTLTEVEPSQSDCTNHGGLFPDLHHLSNLLLEATKHGQTESIRAIATYVACQVQTDQKASIGLKMTAKDTRAAALRERLSLPSIGSARVLLAICEPTFAGASSKQVAAVCGCSEASLVTYISQLKMHLRRHDIPVELIRTQNDWIVPSPRLAEFVESWEELQAIAAIIRDHTLFRAILRTRLKLGSPSEAELVRILLLRHGRPIESDQLCMLMKIDQNSFRVVMSKTRRALRHSTLDGHIVTVQPRGTAEKADYAALPESLFVFLQICFGVMKSKNIWPLFSEFLGNGVISRASIRNARHIAENPWLKNGRAPRERESLSA